MVAVTCPLLGLYVAFHPLVIVCPLGSVNTSDQSLIVELPLLVMVMFAVSPVFHALTTSDTRQATGTPVLGGAEDGGADDGDAEDEGADEGDALGDAEGPVPPATRYITTPCPGTLALIAPLVLLVAPLHRSVNV